MLCSGVPHYQSVRPAPCTATSVTDQCPYSCNNLTDTPLKAQLLCLTGTFSHQAASARFSKLLLSCDPHCSVVKFAFIIKIGNNNKHLGEKIVCSCFFCIMAVLMFLAKAVAMRFSLGLEQILDHWNLNGSCYQNWRTVEELTYPGLKVLAQILHTSHFLKCCRIVQRLMYLFG